MDINLLFNTSIIHYLVLALLLFTIGLCGVLVSRNLLRVVMSLFSMTIAVVINFFAFGYYCDKSLESVNMTGIFVLTIAVIQTVIAVVILYKIYQANVYLDSEKIKDALQNTVGNDKQTITTEIADNGLSNDGEKRE